VYLEDKTMTTLRRHAGGFSLIEVMVSVFVLAVGILGMTGVQTASLKNSAKSVSRTQAAYLSYEILDRMRANPSQLYTVAAADIPNFTNCLTQACTPAQLMAFDLAEWKCSFSTLQSNAKCAPLLGNANSTISANGVYLNGDGTVTCTLVGGEKRCAVSVLWRESDDVKKTQEQQSFTTTVTI
jgi:type IV pilus assembly protein PilV